MMMQGEEGGGVYHVTGQKGNFLHTTYCKYIIFQPLNQFFPVEYMQLFWMEKVEELG